MDRIGSLLRSTLPEHIEIPQDIRNLRMDLAPFSQSLIGNKMVPAKTTHPALGPVLVLFGIRLPYLQQTQKIGAFHAEFPVFLIRLCFLVLWPITRILNTQRGSDDQHTVQCMQLPTFKEHPGDRRINRNMCQLPPDLREIAVFIQGPDFGEQLQPTLNRPWLRRINERKALNRSKIEGFEAQYHRCQIGTVNLRRCELWAPQVIFLTV
ncbi:MAG: hypothetical protein BWY82_01405 [Verrucomicrobia bacterium ADurb.Bin474]|nr:MAG: hypothetical protein BWY82_01405 [Verrucomicrobia bacterium ADurb.Bin474]